MSLEPLVSESVSEICTSRDAHLKRLHLKRNKESALVSKKKKKKIWGWQLFCRVFFWGKFYCSSLRKGKKLIFGRKGKWKWKRWGESEKKNLVKRKKYGEIFLWGIFFWVGKDKGRGVWPTNKNNTRKSQKKNQNATKLNKILNCWPLKMY